MANPLAVWENLSNFAGMERTGKMPVVIWLKVTDYMQSWLQKELGCAHWIKDQRVICVQHLPGAKDTMMMETLDDVATPVPVSIVMSAVRMNIITAGMELDPEVIARDYSLTAESLDGFMPIECPKMCLTQAGVLRPWTLSISMTVKQAMQLQKVLREAFWEAVAAFDAKYAEQAGNNRYPAKEMLEAFCQETGTSDVHVDAMRREWQRRSKKSKSAP